MQFAFDLISDLHVETWDSFDWTGQATSPYCVVAGDVCRDRAVLTRTLTHLGQCYPGGVFYVDGNDEHRDYLEDLGASYKALDQLIKPIPNVVYLQDNVVIVNGVAILGTNGWWTYDLDPAMDFEQTMAWYGDKTHASMNSVTAINGVAYHDAAYLINSVQKLQTHKEVRSIVVVSHTVPAAWLVAHDLQLADTWRFNTTGNPHMQRAMDEDTENKISVWCFGHYHGQVDQDLAGIRWVNNCRGRGDTDWRQVAYYPKRIEIEY
jgi:predicted phosphohydrolase